MTMGKENIKEPVPRDLPVVQTYVPPTQFLEKLRKILTPSIHTLPNLEPIVQPYMPLGLVCNKAKVVREEEHDYDIPLQDHVMQPLTPQTVHIALPDDYVAPTTNLILNKLLNEFREEFADNTRVSEKIDSNPVNDLKELLNTYDFETFIRKLLHQLSQSSHKIDKAKREMKSHQQFSLQTNGIRVLLYSCSCGRKVLYRRNHKGECGIAESCSDIIAFACVILSLLIEDNLCAYECYVNIMWYDDSCMHRGAYDLEVATPRALVYAGLMTSEDARSWYMISGDAKIPTRLNLSLRGIEIPSIECLICNSGMESVEHIFFDCEVAFNIWLLVCGWTDIDMPSFSSWFDSSHWFDDWRASKSNKDQPRAYINKSLQNHNSLHNHHSIIQETMTLENKMVPALVLDGCHEDMILDGKDAAHSDDPFGLYDLLKNKKGTTNHVPSPSLSHPPGFTPVTSENRVENLTETGAPKVFNAQVMNSSQDIPVDSNKTFSGQNVVKSGGSVLDVMEDIIRVGQVMGYSMEGCVKDLENIIGKQGEDNVIR
ncbi:RNA-directed DNA polymerase, eukaryota [Tanacetum coccineum]|uniref:RNA-directed DNA polymerase, eukaryota n=1 Tax=Tanacetum coccineum TaxID=301880 RepID=A0ABQ4XRE3_9ASTR